MEELHQLILRLKEEFWGSSPDSFGLALKITILWGANTFRLDHNLITGSSASPMRRLIISSDSQPRSSARHMGLIEETVPEFG